jgi:hypothetical protein
MQLGAIIWLTRLWSLDNMMGITTGPCDLGYTGSYT